MPFEAAIDLLGGQLSARVMWSHMDYYTFRERHGSTCAARPVKRNVLLSTGLSTITDAPKYAQVVPDIFPRLTRTHPHLYL